MLGASVTEFDMLYNIVLRLEKKVDRIEATLSERAGERRVRAWLMGTASGVAGALLTLGVELFVRKR